MAEETALMERLNEHSEIMSYSREVLHLLSVDDLLKNARDSIEIVDKVRSKVNKGKENTSNTIKVLEDKKSMIEQTILAEYQSAMEGVVSADLSQPNMQSVKHEIERLHKQVRERERDFKKLENEKKILEFHKKHRKLQKKIANTQFDMTSDENHIKGYIKKSDGQLQTFEFDFTKDSPCYIADFLWDSI